MKKRVFVLKDGREFRLGVQEFGLYNQEFMCVLLLWNDNEASPMIFAMGLDENVLEGLYWCAYSHFQYHEVVSFCDMIEVDF